MGAALRGRLPGLGDILTAAPVDYLFMNWDLVRASDVTTCHAHGVAVGTFEGWDTSFDRHAHDLGIDYVLSDDPTACRRHSPTTTSQGSDRRSEPMPPMHR